MNLKVDSPRKRSRRTVTATIEETAPAADRQRQSQGQSKAVSGLDADAENPFCDFDTEVSPDQSRGNGFAIGQPGGLKTSEVLETSEVCKGERQLGAQRPANEGGEQQRPARPPGQGGQR